MRKILELKGAFQRSSRAFPGDQLSLGYRCLSNLFLEVVRHGQQTVPTLQHLYLQQSFPHVKFEYLLLHLSPLLLICAEQTWDIAYFFSLRKNKRSKNPASLSPFEDLSHSCCFLSSLAQVITSPLSFPSVVSHYSYYFLLTLPNDSWIVKSLPNYNP